MKECNKCHNTIHENEFYSVNKRNKKALYHICKKCCAAQKASLKDYSRNWELKKKYGINLEEYIKQSIHRENKCDICSKVVESLHVDHNHTTGMVRGYLCGSCNRALGLFQDSKEILGSAYNYLTNHA